jgi:DNA primase
MKPFLYLPSKDLFFGFDGNLYSHDDIDTLDRIREKWQSQLPNLSFFNLMEIFPNAAKEARRGLKEKVKECKQNLKEVTQSEQLVYDSIITKVAFKEQQYVRELFEQWYEYQRKQINEQKKQIELNLLYLDGLEGKGKKIVMPITDQDIALAKQLTITNYYTDKLQHTGKRAKGNCPFHKEKTGSFTIYTDQNSWYCFGCAEGGSVVDYIMKLLGLNFLQAVKFLLKK